MSDNGRDYVAYMKSSLEEIEDLARRARALVERAKDGRRCVGGAFC